MSVNTKFSYWLIGVALMVACTPPVFVPEAAEENSLNPNWENTGSINASFFSSTRSVGVNTTSGSPTFDVSFIASAGNIDSLHWSFPGGLTNDDVSEVTETVTYQNFGRFDVGLEVYNLEDKDKRFYENFIEIYYEDDFVFDGLETTSWTVSGTSTPDDFVTASITNAQSLNNWTIIPYHVTHQVEATKSFVDFPANNLILEFDYKLERVPVIYIENASIVSTSPSSPTIVSYLDPEDTATTSNTRVDSPATYPGSKQFSIEYNGIPIWIASSVSDNYFKHVKLELPSLSSFEIKIVREAQDMLVKQYAYPYDALASDNPTLTTPTTIVTPSFDIDGDGIANDADNDMDGDGYTNSLEATNFSLISDPNSVPKYYIQHLKYPYDLNIRNFTIKLKETNP
ncbi:MAG: hypothetical protein ACPHUE_03455 [Flavobacteriaceae bacterium]